MPLAAVGFACRDKYFPAGSEVTLAAIGPADLYANLVAAGYIVSALPNGVTNSVAGTMGLTATIIVPFSATRQQLMITSRTTGTETQDIGSSNVTVGGGIPLQPGGGFLFDGVGAAGPIYGITTATGSAYSYVEGVSAVPIASALTNSASGTMGTTAAIVVPFSSTRKWLMITNRSGGTETQDLGSSNVTVGGGVPLLPGGGFLFTGVGAAGPLYGITTTPGSPYSYVEG